MSVNLRVGDSVKHEWESKLREMGVFLCGSVPGFSLHPSPSGVHLVGLCLGLLCTPPLLVSPSGVHLVH